MTEATIRQAGIQRDRGAAGTGLDGPLLIAAASLALSGLVMVASASMPMADRALGEPFHYFQRQLVYLLLGLATAAVLVRIPLELWLRARLVMMIGALAVLAVVLIPGLGKTVHGSTRWLDFGLFQVQTSEPARLMLVLYLAGFLAVRGELLARHYRVILGPVVILALACLLLLAQPDFGAAVVLMGTALVMLFLGGVRLLWFLGVFGAASAALGMLVWTSPYRLDRLTGFLHPWQDPFSSGFQLTQSLIAIGSGGWLGVGLGDSVQKLFYLPEVHTDFMFAVIAEELGLVGATAVIGLYAVVVWRGLAIGAWAARREQWFGAYLAWGLTAWLGSQAFINIGVNMGLLPTTGLTLPVMSYGGSSVLVTCAALGLMLRVGKEARDAEEVSI